jgi:cob(I)alamin adenosyltransferase
MADQPTFDAPKRIAINRVYTRKGDAGDTSLVGGQKVPKHELRIEVYGTVDELNAFVGAARQTLAELTPRPPGLDWLDGALLRVQHELFNLGSILATLPGDVSPKQPRVRPSDVSRLEREIDRCNADLTPLRSFVLPGGSRLNTDLHKCRTICRRCERLCAALFDRLATEPREATGRDRPDPSTLAYLNRLSDAFFVWSRWVVFVRGDDEVLWDPNLPSAGD